MRSKIIISEDFERIKTELKYECDPNYLRFFEYDSALAENAREIVAEAYIAEKYEKVIAIFARKFGLEWQNALLKILEEPPRNIVFIIVSPAKNLLIPTIRSRLVLENRLTPPKRVNSGLNLRNLDLKMAYKFVEEKISLEKQGKFAKFELLGILKSIVCDALDCGVKLSGDDLQYCSKLYSLAELNAKSAQILTPLLLLIIERQK